MIARVWHGVVPVASAEAYSRYIEETGGAEARRTPGNRGVLVLRRVAGPQVHFLFTSFWESLQAIRRFAGDDLDRAVYYPRDREFLLGLEPRVVHYEVVEPPRADLAAHFARILRPLG